MALIERIRRRSNRLAQISAGLFVLMWLSIAAAPCAIAMSLGSVDDHDCPHCPPRPCHEVQVEECEAPDSIDGLRALDASSMVAPPPHSPIAVTFERQRQLARGIAFHPPARAGPRAHLLHVQFNE